MYTSFHFTDSGFYLLNGFDLYFDLFLEWRDTENQLFEPLYHALHIWSVYASVQNWKLVPLIIFI